MFAQLLITIVIAWLLTELLSRAVLKVPAYEALRDLLGMDDLGDPAEVGDDVDHADLRRLLMQRRHDLEEARVRLNLASRASDVTDQLEVVEAELERVELRLAEAEGNRGTH